MHVHFRYDVLLLEVFRSWHVITAGNGRSADAETNKRDGCATRLWRGNIDDDASLQDS